MAKNLRSALSESKAQPAAAARLPAPDAAPETPYRITDYPMHYFAAIQRQNQLNLARALREFGLSVPMWRALSALHQKDGQTIGEIAQLAVLDRSSLGRLLDEMAKAKLVEREPLPDDRRALAGQVCRRKGRRIFEATLPLAQRHYRNVFKGVSARGIRNADARASPDQGEYPHDGGYGRSRRHSMTAGVR